MNEVIEKKKKEDPRRGYSLKEDVKNMKNEMDWTHSIMPWED
jgi:hypothetical protein